MNEQGNNQNPINNTTVEGQTPQTNTPIDSNVTTNNVEVINANNTQPEVLNVEPVRPQPQVQVQSQQVVPPVQPTVEVQPQVQPNNMVIEENKEEVVPQSVQDEPLTFKKKVQYFFLGIFFIIVAVFIYFLPEINEYLSTEDFNKKEEIITTGVLVCSVELDEGNLTYKTTDEFTFRDELLKKYTRTAEISTSSEGVTEIGETENQCQILLEQTRSLSGINVNCNSNSNFQRTTQTIDYETVNPNKATAAFTEAGGTYPEYSLDTKIGDIESAMKGAGFECRRQKNNLH